MEKLTRQIQSRVNKLPPGLQAHINRVSDIARELALHHRVDQDRAALGMLAHDVARAMPDQELLRHAAEFNLPVTLVERRTPVMLHGLPFHSRTDRTRGRYNHRLTLVHASLCQGAPHWRLLTTGNTRRARWDAAPGSRPSPS